jgi:S1-C subfamily serine protease
VRWVLAAALTLAPGCAHRSPAEEGLQEGLPGEGPSAADESLPTAEVEGPPPAPLAPERHCTSFKSPGVIKRSAVVEVVDAGLGRWLSGVSIERKLEKRRFAGWTIHSLHLANPCYAAVDLRPGDVVVAVNGRTRELERPDTVFVVWNELKTAKAIEVVFVRDGKRQTTRFDIAD